MAYLAYCHRGWPKKFEIGIVIQRKPNPRTLRDWCIAIVGCGSKWAWHYYVIPKVGLKRHLTIDYMAINGPAAPRGELQ